MKIVINACYGGFSLSARGTKRWAKLKGRNCFFFKHGRNNGDIAIDKLEPISMEEAEKEFMWHAYDSPTPPKSEKPWKEMSMKERQANNEIQNSHSLYSRDIPRDDEALIQVVEELEKQANGKHADLRVVEIPDGVSWEIDEYDGFEHIAESHRTWS